MSGTALSRLTEYSFGKVYFTPFQSQVDFLTTQIVSHAVQIDSFCALISGGTAAVLTESALLKWGAPLLHRSPLGFSVGLSLISLFSETTAFQLVSETFRCFREKTPLTASASEFSDSFVNLGSVKVFGRLGRNQNLVTRHLLVDAGILTGWRLTHPGETGNLAEQVTQAEAFHWQMKGAAGLMQGIHPKLTSWQESLRFSLRVEIQENFKKEWNDLQKDIPTPTAYALAGKVSLPERIVSDEIGKKPTPLMMATNKKSGRELPPEGGLPYRTIDAETRRLLALTQTAERLRYGILNEQSPQEVEKLQKEYATLAQELAPATPHLYEEAGKWSPHFISRHETRGDRALEAYQSVIPNFREGDGFVYEEAHRLSQLGKTSKTQNGRYRSLKAMELLSEKFTTGDDAVYPLAVKVRRLFAHPSPHTQRQAFRTYEAISLKFQTGHFEIFRGERAIKGVFPKLDLLTRQDAQRTLDTLERNHPLKLRLQRFGDGLLRFIFFPWRW